MYLAALSREGCTDLGTACALLQPISPRAGTVCPQLGTLRSCSLSPQPHGELLPS